MTTFNALLWAATDDPLAELALSDWLEENSQNAVLIAPDFASLWQGFYGYGGYGGYGGHGGHGGYGGYGGYG